MEEHDVTAPEDLEEFEMTPEEMMEFLKENGLVPVIQEFDDDGTLISEHEATEDELFKYVNTLVEDEEES